MPKQKLPKTKNWYVVHTYSGYEEAVAKNLKQRIESMAMEDKIFNVLVPKEKKIKIVKGKRKVIEEKVYPGYILVEMVVTDDSWYVVRNTPNVTGFVGAGVTPIPVSQGEIDILQKRMGVKEPEYKIDLRTVIYTCLVRFYKWHWLGRKYKRSDCRILFCETARVWIT